MSQEIISYYESYDEDSRLERNNFHRIEFLTTMRYLEKTIPADSRILDACAGTGAYSLALARRGHSVTVCDLVPKHIEELKNKDSGNLIKDARVCNILDMSCFADRSFDAVLCMGALYHLFSQEERGGAVRECLRVLKPGGIFAAAFINRHAQLILVLAHEGMDKYDAVLELVETGILDATNSGLIFYRSTPGEMAALMGRAGLEKISMIGTDGIGHIIAGLINGMSDEELARWMEYHLSCCEDETLLGHSLHGLYIGRKPL